MICKRCNHSIEPDSDYEVENQQHFLQDCFEYVVADRERFRDASNNNLAGWENERNHLIVKVADRERDIDALKDQVTECEMKLAALEDPVDPDTIHVEYPIRSVHEACEAKLKAAEAKLAEAEREADERMAADHASLVEWEERAATEERRAIAVEAKLAEVERERDEARRAERATTDALYDLRGIAARAEALEKALLLLQEAVRAVGKTAYWDGPHWNLHVPQREANALFDLAYGEVVTAALARKEGP